MTATALAEKPAATVAVMEPRYRLKESRIKRAEFDNTVWAVAIEANTPYAKLFEPEFWANITVARNMKIGDELKIFPDEGHYFARLYVRDVGPKWAKVAELYKVEFEGAQLTSGEEVASGFKIEYRGRVDKHAVIRTKDNEVVHRGANSPADAQTWLREYSKALAK